MKGFVSFTLYALGVDVHLWVKWELRSFVWTIFFMDQD
jgi:hypothetical protein